MRMSGRYYIRIGRLLCTMRWGVIIHIAARNVFTTLRITRAPRSCDVDLNLHLSEFRGLIGVI